MLRMKYLLFQKLIFLLYSENGQNPYQRMNQNLQQCYLKYLKTHLLIVLQP
jgi:hypothetical protein